MKLSNLFKRYEALAEKGDQAFQRMEEEYGECISCRLQCSECCHAVFGLFLIEAAYLRHHFSLLRRKDRHEALLRGEAMDEELERVERNVKAFEQDPQMRAYALAREKVRCPLLDDNQECILYPCRPITCRVYGIPVKVKNVSRVCGKSGFEGGKSYPSFDLDSVNRELHELSVELLKEEGIMGLEKASFLISVSKAIRTPFVDLITEDLQEQGRME